MYQQDDLTPEQYQQVSQVMDVVIDRSQNCERGVLATTEDGMAGLALVGPNVIMYAFQAIPGVFVLDYCLN